LIIAGHSRINSRYQIFGDTTLRSEYMTNVKIILAIGVGVWTATNVVFSTIKIANERRDAVVTGYLDKQQLTRRHKQIIMYSDWLPMFAGVAVLTMGGAAVLATLPWWVPKMPSIEIDSLYVTIASVTGFVLFALMFASMVGGGVTEFLLMRSALKEMDEPIDKTS
jgi:hypothetical protein